HCGSRSFPAKGFGDFPNKQNGRPGRGGTVRFSEVWLHFLCLLFLFFSAISTFGKLQTTRKTGTSPEKSAKNKDASASPQTEENRGWFSGIPRFFLLWLFNFHNSFSPDLNSSTTSSISTPPSPVLS